MAKKINASNLNKGYSKFNEKTTEHITDRFGEEYNVEITKFFKKTDIVELLKDFSTVKIQLKDKVEDESLLTDFTYIYPILLIKYFTNIIVPEKAEDMVQLSTQLINLEIMDKLMNILPQDEVSRVSSYMKQAVENLPKTLDILGIVDKESELVEEEVV